MAKLTSEEERTAEAVIASIPSMGDYDRGFIEGFARGRITKASEERSNPSGEAIAG